MFGKAVKEMESITDKQSEKLEILTRLDELDRVQAVTTDESTLKWIQEQKKELRERLTTL